MKRLNVILVDLSIFTCVFTCVTAIVVCATLPRNDALITKENFARLKKGMTHTEVETIIGKRPPRRGYVEEKSVGPPLTDGWTSEWWEREDGALIHLYFHRGWLDEMTWHDAETWWQRVRRWVM
jgi:hypothetical protein